MSRISVAFQAFFAALFSAAKAAQLKAVLDARMLPKTHSAEKPPPAPAPRAQVQTARSDAITLLAALQREARLVDLVKQPLASFSDEQIGAAARNVLQECSAVLDRFFALQAVMNQEEDLPCDVPAGYDPACFKLSGRVEGNGPFHGRLVHRGWKATAVKLPAWTGSTDSVLVIAPAEVEI